MMAHIDEEMLVSVAELGADQDTYPHLDECDDCRASVEQYRAVVLSLADEATWDLHALDETPNPQTIANLRAYVEQMQREDAEAEPLVAELLAGPREEWMPRLMADEKYRTAGVVRKLIAATDRAIDTMPPDAVEITKLACDIADKLDSAGYPVRALLRLRGATHLDLAYSLFYVGSIGDAARASFDARALFEAAGGSEFEIARVDLTLAQISRASDNIGDGLRLVESAREQFDFFQDSRRVAIALATKAYLLSKANNFSEARRLWTDVVTGHSDVLDDAFRADLLLNIGFCSRELGDLEHALEMFKNAAFVFETLQIPSRIVRARYNVAAVLSAGGRLDAAASEFIGVTQELERLGMFGTAAVALLDLVEVRIAQERYQDVKPICQEVLGHLERSGLSGSSRAFRALALLRDAATHERVSATLVQNVRMTVREESKHLPQIQLLQVL
jgi:tetratricopeptide (TPR) repeat protein